MTKNRQGKEWNKSEDEQLTNLFNKHCSYYEMGKKLGRSWFACKCRLARLGLIEPFEYNKDHYYIGNMEKFTVPNFNLKWVKYWDIDEIEDEDTSTTFSNAELNIVTDWLKTRLSLVVCKLADGENLFVKTLELNTVKQLLETEISVANSMKKLTVEERKKVLKRL